MKTQNRSEAVKLAAESKLNTETAEPLWRLACSKLKKGERPPFRQVTFTLHDSQWKQLDTALKRVKKDGATSKVNANSNGNAIARIVREWLRAGDGQRPYRRPRRPR
ncbi:MAG: hypothetical protein IT167_31895 [Bryobacterales bacterium]|nr:hypothetical protein [Bryobacterales bacterium]